MAATNITSHEQVPPDEAVMLTYAPPAGASAGYCLGVASITCSVLMLLTVAIIPSITYCRRRYNRARLVEAANEGLGRGLIVTLYFWAMMSVANIICAAFSILFYRRINDHNKYPHYSLQLRDGTTELEPLTYSGRDVAVLLQAGIVLTLLTLVSYAAYLTSVTIAANRDRAAGRSGSDIAFGLAPLLPTSSGPSQWYPLATKWLPLWHPVLLVVLVFADASCMWYIFRKIVFIPAASGIVAVDTTRPRLAAKLHALCGTNLLLLLLCILATAIIVAVVAPWKPWPAKSRQDEATTTVVGKTDGGNITSYRHLSSHSVQASTAGPATATSLWANMSCSSDAHRRVYFVQRRWDCLALALAVLKLLVPLLTQLPFIVHIFAQLAGEASSTTTTTTASDSNPLHFPLTMSLSVGSRTSNIVSYVLMASQGIVYFVLFVATLALHCIYLTKVSAVKAPRSCASGPGPRTGDLLRSGSQLWKSALANSDGTIGANSIQPDSRGTTSCSGSGSGRRSRAYTLDAPVSARHIYVHRAATICQRGTSSQRYHHSNHQQYQHRLSRYGSDELFGNWGKSSTFYTHPRAVSHANLHAFSSPESPPGPHSAAVFGQQQGDPTGLHPHHTLHNCLNLPELDFEDLTCSHRIL